MGIMYISKIKVGYGQGLCRPYEWNDRNCLWVLVQELLFVFWTTIFCKSGFKGFVLITGVALPIIQRIGGVKISFLGCIRFYISARENSPTFQM